MDHKLSVDSVEIAFENGSMKDILVKGRLTQTKGEPYRFENINPIPVRSPNDIEKLRRIGLEQNFLVTRVGENKKYYIDLAQLLLYDRNVIGGSGDYVPRNGVVKLRGDVLTPYPLVKKSFLRNFDVRIYTDLTGLKENKPNGLVQIEASYLAITNTRYVRNELITPLNRLIRFPTKIPLISKLYNWFYEPIIANGPWILFGRMPQFVRNKFVWRNQLQPFVTFSKIEEESSVLPVQTFQPNSILESFNYVSTFDLYQFSNLRLGLRANILSLISQATKARLDVVGGLYRTKVDSVIALPDTARGETELSFIANPRNVHSWYLLPELSVQVIADGRLDFDFKYGAIFSKLIGDDEDNRSLTPALKQTNKGLIDSDVPAEAKETTDFGFWDWGNVIHKFQISLNVHPTQQSRNQSIFFRGTLFVNSPRNNLSLQIGYTTPITKLFSPGSQ